MKIPHSYTRWKAGLLLFLIILAAQVLVIFPKASAVLPNVTSVRLDRLAKSAATTGLVCLEPSVAGDSEGKLVLTFPGAFTVGLSATWTTQTATTTGWPSGAIAYPSISSGTASGQTVTFTSGDLSSASQVYCFNWTSSTALTNPSSTGSQSITVATQTSGGGALESSTATTNIVDTNCGAGSTPCDQIAVTATVNQSFTFSLSANAAGLGTLLTSSPSSATAINASVTTNAKTGWQMWGADLGSPVGLRSSTASYTVPYSPAVGASAAALTAGNEGYNVGARAHTGTCNGSFTYDPAFDDNAATAFKGGGLDGTMRTIASATSTANGCAVPLVVSGSISNVTLPATDYAGTITVIAAGLF